MTVYPRGLQDANKLYDWGLPSFHLIPTPPDPHRDPPFSPASAPRGSWVVTPGFPSVQVEK